MNIATVSHVNISSQTSVPSKLGEKNSLFATLYKEEQTSKNLDAEDQSKQLKQLISSIKELLELDAEKESKPKHLRGIPSMIAMGELEGVTPDLAGGPWIKFLDEIQAYHQEKDEENLIHVSLFTLLNHIENGDVTKDEFVRLEQSLTDMLTNNPEETKLSHPLLVELTSILLSLEQKLTNKHVDEHHLVKQMRHSASEDTLINDKSNASNRMFVLNELHQISQQAHELIEKVLTEEHTVDMNKQLTQLLEKMQQFKQDSFRVNEEVTLDETNDAEKIWMNLQSMYDKRTSMIKGGAYVENAKVRATDVGSWLQHLVNETNVSHSLPHIQLQQQMTPVEQYVMHVRTNEGVTGQNEQLMQQFQQIMNQSALHKNQFFKQLSITIQPEQLGEITVRLVQIEGELIAKITVTSQATKSALESNLHQLKNMFAPHQIMIDKQDVNEQTNFKQENPEEGQHHSSHEHNDEQHTNEQEERSFQDQFEQILEETVGEQ